MNDSKQISRRRFLFAAGAGGAAATVLVAARKDGAGKGAAKAKSPADGAGYRLTEHISNYYRTTRV